MPIGNRLSFYRKRRGGNSSPWKSYLRFLDSASGDVLINKKEWRDGFGAVVSSNGNFVKLTGARVDDNKLAKITASSKLENHNVEKHNELLSVVRSLGEQTHLDAESTNSQDPPRDANWHKFGMEPVVYEDPGFSSLQQVQLYGVEVEAGFSNAYVVMKIRGDENETAEAYVEFRRKGTQAWRRSPQFRSIHGVEADKRLEIERHISGPLLRLAPGTTYEFRCCIEHDASLGSSTSWENPLRTPVYSFKTRHQPYAPKTGLQIVVETREQMFQELGASATIPGGYIKIASGDYTLESDKNGEQLEINLSGTREEPLLVQGIGTVTIPRIKMTGSWVILHNVQVVNRTAYEGEHDNSKNTTSSIVVNEPDSRGLVLSKVNLKWPEDMPQTWEDGYRAGLNYDLKHTKLYGVPRSGGPAGESPKWTVVENCDLTEGPAKNLEDIWEHKTRPVEWIGNEGFDIRHQSLTLRNCRVINNYDNSLTGTGSGNGLACFAYIANNLFAFNHDDVIELEKGQGGNVLFENIVAGALAGNQPATGMATIPDTSTRKTEEKTVIESFEVNSENEPTGGGAATGRWAVTFSESVPGSSYGSLWQNGKCWTRLDGGPTSFPILYTNDINKAHPGNDDIYATNTDEIKPGICRVAKTNRQPFNGSNTVSVQDSTTGTLPNWLVSWQHSGIHDTGTPDSPSKWKQHRAGNFVNCFQVTQRGCSHMYKPGMGGGYYYVNNTFMSGQNSWDNQSTSSIDDLGSWYGDPYPYGLMNWNAYYNNNLNKRYWGNRSLSRLFSDFGIDEDSHDYADLRETDNVLDVSYENMWDEPARNNRNKKHIRPNWTYNDFPGSGGTLGSSCLGTYKPLVSRATNESRNYGTGVPHDNPVAWVVGPSISTNDDVSFLGCPNKTENKTDVAPHQALMGWSTAGTLSTKNHEQYNVPTGWKAISPFGTTAENILSALGMRASQQEAALLLVNSDNSMAVLVEHEKDK